MAQQVLLQARHEGTRDHDAGCRIGAAVPASEIAKLLVDRSISAVLVVDDKGAPIGMVSEGDLIAAT
jgi:CBS-domain-containing membrane protein